MSLFKSEPTLKEKVTEKVSASVNQALHHLPHKETPREKYTRWALQGLLYFSLVLGGYLLAKVQMLIG